VSARFIRGRFGGEGNRVDRYNNVGLGARYSFAQGFFVEGAYYDYRYDGKEVDNVVALRIGYEFGDGKAFGSRSYSGLYPGD